ncbi:MAG: RagB/SusD family nutrient uptake outer membrane protein [Chitinophagaceae bacterium]
MKQIIRYTGFCFLIGITATACKKDWLSPAQENQLVKEDSTFNDPTNAVKFVNAAYNQLLAWNTTTFSWIGMSSITSDDADKGSSPGDNGTDKDQMDAISYTSTSASLNEVWIGLYQGVNRCNQALANVPKFNIDQSLKNRLAGEARFLRAYFYFNLVRCWGAVPLVDTVLDANNSSDFSKGNTRRDTTVIYDFIENDLRFAMSVLPTKQQYAASEMGRATQGAAAAMLAKVSMYRKKWNQALTLTDDIIAQKYGTYSMVTDYTTMWREVGENSSESLFEIQGKGTVPTAGVQQYSQVQGMRAATFSGVTNVYTGWGFNTPSADLDNAYETGDVRKNSTIIHIGDVLFDGAKLVSAENARYNYKAYISKTQESYGDGDVSNKNVRILRMGEMYLINAEAANELSQSGKALISLNLVRARARGGVSGVLPDVTTTDQTGLRTAIWKERRVELAMEHDRFFDIIRQGRAGTIMRAQGKNFVDGVNEVFPIPDAQISASGGQLIQNKGYN